MTTRNIDYKTLVDLAEQKIDDQPVEHPAYEFTNKTFYEDDSAGVYGDDEE